MTAAPSTDARVEHELDVDVATEGDGYLHRFQEWGTRIAAGNQDVIPRWHWDVESAIGIGRERCELVSGSVLDDHMCRYWLGRAWLAGDLNGALGSCHRHAPDAAVGVWGG